METNPVTPESAPMMSAPVSSIPSVPLVKYAGFWRRFAAYLIDGLILNLVIWPLAFLFGLGNLMSAMTASSLYHTHDSSYTYTHTITQGDAALIGAIFSFYLMLAGVSMLVYWLYSAFMESSAKQGTLGKMALGIRVTDLNGNRISFGRATGRHFAKIISGLILGIGYLMAGFTDKKQALHDIIASTLVIQNP